MILRLMFSLVLRRLVDEYILGAGFVWTCVWFIDMMSGACLYQHNVHTPHTADRSARCTLMLRCIWKDERVKSRRCVFNYGDDYILVP